MQLQVIVPWAGVTHPGCRDTGVHGHGQAYSSGRGGVGSIPCKHLCIWNTSQEGRVRRVSRQDPRGNSPGQQGIRFTGAKMAVG